MLKTEKQGDKLSVAGCSLDHWKSLRPNVPSGWCETDFILMWSREPDQMLPLSPQHHLLSTPEAQALEAAFTPELSGLFTEADCCNRHDMGARKKKCSDLGAIFSKGKLMCSALACCKHGALRGAMLFCREQAFHRSPGCVFALSVPQAGPARLPDSGTGLFRQKCPGETGRERGMD